MSTIFNFNRAGLLVQRYFTEKFYSELIFLSIMSVVFMFFRNNPNIIGITILIAGAFYTGNFFREIHSPSGGINYFMIPATQLEKMTVSLLLTIAYYFIMMLIAYIVGNLVGTGLNNLLANINFLSADLGLFHPSPVKWELFEVIGKGRVSIEGEQVATTSGNSSWICLFLKIFLVTQSLFVLGGIYFKHNQTFKTLLALILIGFVFSIACGVGILLIIGKSIYISSIQTESLTFWNNMITTTFKIFYYLLIPFLWTISYFRLTEKEI